ncbi:MAG: heme exporter protein CcmB [Chloroflexota bacterium]|jgi:heme exporter protein B|nr:MAG: heme ABC transporter permease CcmB [SAR202 cluster bacterium]MAR86521.1 heme ABC transporter permease CcmB [Chloroflexota bacterium]MEE3345570.1 heme exporter protein CcmB [Chloroflexota bacterium]|tara:strand:+ start:857 stop:1537 length:681 start_codon:yes stop_codon:yes gene_type:complete
MRIKKYFYHLFVMVRKDFLLEVRSKDVVLPVFIFSFLVVVTFNFALESTPNTANLIVPGILWVSVLFGAMVGFGRMFLSESEQGAFQGLLTAPIGRDVIFFGKVISNVLFLLLIESILLPILVVLFNVTLSPLYMLYVSIPALFGISLSGMLFASISMNMRAKEVMLPILFLPVVVPIILGAVESTYAVMNGDNLDQFLKWITLMIVFDLIYSVLGPVSFTMIVED